MATAVATAAVADATAPAAISCCSRPPLLLPLPLPALPAQPPLLSLLFMFCYPLTRALALVFYTHTHARTCTHKHTCMAAAHLFYDRMNILRYSCCCSSLARRGVSGTTHECISSGECVRVCPYVSVCVCSFCHSIFLFFVVFPAQRQAVCVCVFLCFGLLLLLLLCTSVL